MVKPRIDKILFPTLAKFMDLVEAGKIVPRDNDLSQIPNDLFFEMCERKNRRQDIATMFSLLYAKEHKEEVGDDEWRKEASYFLTRFQYEFLKRIGLIDYKLKGLPDDKNFAVHIKYGKNINKETVIKLLRSQPTLKAVAKILKKEVVKWPKDGE